MPSNHPRVPCLAVGVALATLAAALPARAQDLPKLDYDLSLETLYESASVDEAVLKLVPRSFDELLDTSDTYLIVRTDPDTPHQRDYGSFHGTLLLSDASVTGTLTPFRLRRLRDGSVITDDAGWEMIQLWYVNADGSQTRFLTDAAGNEIGEVTVSGDSRTTSIDANGDRVVDVMEIVHPTGRRTLYIGNGGLEFWRDWARGINPMCFEMPVDLGYGAGADPSAGIPGCNLNSSPLADGVPYDSHLVDEQREGGLVGSPLDPFCGGESSEGFDPNQIIDEVSAGSTRSRDFGYGLCMAMCGAAAGAAGLTAAGATSVTGPGAIVGAAAAGGAVFVLCFSVCDRVVTEETTTAVPESGGGGTPSSEDPEPQPASQQPRYRDTDDDGTLDAEDTDGDGEVDTTCGAENCGVPVDSGTETDQVEDWSSVDMSAFCRDGDEHRKPEEMLEEALASNCYGIETNPSPYSENGDPVLPPGFSCDNEIQGSGDLVTDASGACADDGTYESGEGGDGESSGICLTLYGELFEQLGNILALPCDPIVCMPPDQLGSFVNSEIGLDQAIEVYIEMTDPELQQPYGAWFGGELPPF